MSEYVLSKLLRLILGLVVVVPRLAFRLCLFLATGELGLGGVDLFDT